MCTERAHLYATAHHKIDIAFAKRKIHFQFSILNNLLRALAKWLSSRARALFI